MEKFTKPSEHETITKRSTEVPKRVIWDCGSSLYDSFELKSFGKQLNSAMVSRTHSMPHLSGSRLPNPPPRPNMKPTSKISRSINRLLRAVFRPKNNTSGKFNNNSGAFEDELVSQRYNHDGSPVLSTISEVPEYEGLMLSPDLRKLIFTSTMVLNTCKL